MKMRWLTAVSLTLLLLFAFGVLVTEGGGRNAPESAVTLEFTFPAGESPSVFQTGWVFGARCVVNPGLAEERDISGQVRWSGTGLFNPPVGALTRPFFTKPGKNKITITAEVDGRSYRRDLTVNAVSTLKYAAVGDNSFCRSCAHGCPACPHVVTGPIMTGSPNVMIGGKPAARKGDTGIHAACCGPNSFEIAEGDPNVLIDGRPAARLGDATNHCGGSGKITAVSNYDPKLSQENILEWILFEEDMPPGFSFASRSPRYVTFGGRTADYVNYNTSLHLDKREMRRRAAERYNQYARVAADRVIARDLGIGERSLIVGNRRRREHAFYTSQDLRIYWKEWDLSLNVYGYYEAGIFTDQQATEYLKQLGATVFERFVAAQAF